MGAALSGYAEEREFENLIKSMNLILKSINESKISDLKEKDKNEIREMPIEFDIVNNFMSMAI